MIKIHSTEAEDDGNGRQVNASHARTVYYSKSSMPKNTSTRLNYTIVLNCDTTITTQK